MRTHTVEATATTSAPPERVYALLLDRAEWLRWSPLDTSDLETPGPDDPEGVGSVRRQTMGKVTGYDTIVELVPNARFVYTNLGMPTREYTGHVELTRTESGCRIHWQSTFVPKYPGTAWLLRREFLKLITRCAEGLAAYADKED